MNIFLKKCKEVALKIMKFEKEYAAPTEDEIAVFMPNSLGQFSEQFLTYRHILLRDMNGQNFPINEMNPLYDPLHYPLMFPYGDLGYEYQRGKKNLHKCTINRSSKFDQQSHFTFFQDYTKNIYVINMLKFKAGDSII